MGILCFRQREHAENFGRENMRNLFFFSERTPAELRGSSRNLWTADSVAHKSHAFREGYEQHEVGNFPFFFFFILI